MEHYLYIIYSKSLDRFYIGETPDIENRHKQHKKHYFKTNYTKAANDWTIAIQKKCASKEDALFLEKFIKRMKSKKFIYKIIADPMTLDQILLKK